MGADGKLISNPVQKIETHFLRVIVIVSVVWKLIIGIYEKTITNTFYFHNVFGIPMPLRIQ